MIPDSLRITASAWAVVSTMQIVRWHRAATASGEASTLAPAATSGSSRAGLMSCTTSSNPALTRLSDIGPPILPSPINPTLPAIGSLPANGDDRSISRLTGNPARFVQRMAVSGTGLPGVPLSGPDTSVRQLPHVEEGIPDLNHGSAEFH